MVTVFRGADIVVQTLIAADVARLFSLSGNHVMSLYDATINNNISITHVRHEAAAVHMADAWSRLTGQLGVALVTGGPGHANSVSALYTALASESPLLLLSGHAPRMQLGLGAFQEMAQADMAAPVCKASWTIEHVEDIPEALARAVRIATGGRPGPVHLSLPEDVLNAVATDVHLPEPSAFKPTVNDLKKSTAHELSAELKAARRPLILAGPYASTAAAGNMLADLEAATGIPALVMESPRGINDPALGAFAEILNRSDCLLLLGKQPDFTLNYCSPPALSEHCRILQVDPDTIALERLQIASSNFQRMPLQCQADLLPAARAIAKAFQSFHSASEWYETVRQAVTFRPLEWNTIESHDLDTLHPAELCSAVQPLLDESSDAVLVCDGGEFGQWAQACLQAPHRIINGPAGAIGSSLAFALAASLAFPRSPVIAMMGDGTLGFHLAEFDTGVRYDLPFIAVVGNDACWNAEYQIQLRNFGPERAIGCELLPSRYDSVAIALGGFGAFANCRKDLDQALGEARSSRKPACVNVMIERVPAPLIRRG